jgi:hypothetical protein
LGPEGLPVDFNGLVVNHISVNGSSLLLADRFMIGRVSRNKIVVFKLILDVLTLQKVIETFMGFGNEGKGDLVPVHRVHLSKL